jgi:hypothetical protein
MISSDTETSETHMDEQPTSLEQLLDRINIASENKARVTLKAVIDALGGRSFGPLLLLAGLIILSPIIGDIPGIPTIMGLLVFLTAGQLLLRRKYFWLPTWLLNRSVRRDMLRRSIEWIRPASRFVDRSLRPRLSTLTRHAGLYLTAIACIVIAVAIPIMELIPFSAKLAGSTLIAFGLSLIARNGVLTLFALLVTVTTIGMGVYCML